MELRIRLSVWLKQVARPRELEKGGWTKDTWCIVSNLLHG